jgi:PAS domain S-box-containing protein
LGEQEARARVLVVDDDPPKRYAIGRTLRKYGFEVIEASCGEEALRLSQSEDPDLVLLDVGLPDIHGFEVARRIKASDRTRHTPVLHLSASAISAEDRVDGLSAGADAYLVDPVEPGELVANIRALLRLRNAEAGLQHTSSMLAAVIESSPLAIAAFDGEQRVVRWNPAAERLFGITAADLEGQLVSASSLPPLMKRLRDITAPGADHGTTAPIECEYLRADGTIVDIAMFAAPVERPRGYVAIFEDISSRKRFERERSQWLSREREARTEAEAASRLKDEFLATLSHELRTPLNAILGWLQILRQKPVAHEKRERALQVIERNARAQQQIINDILEVSQIVRGQLRLEMQPLDVVAAVEAAIESVRPTASAKRQTLKVVLPQAPVFISADPARVQQMLWNLLANATKYTPREGRIDVEVTAGDADVEIIVRDNGIGISADTLPHVFERFRQGDAGPTREYGGLGLGLAIVRHLADMHGGSVRAASEGTGQGAVFTLTLPVVEQPELA